MKGCDKAGLQDSGEWEIKTTRHHGKFGRGSSKVQKFLSSKTAFSATSMKGCDKAGLQDSDEWEIKTTGHHARKESDVIPRAPGLAGG